MNLNLEIHPGSTWEWEEFLSRAKRHAVALDGIVRSPTRFDHNDAGWAMNFDHHRDVDRLSTRATCAQLLVYARMGLYRALAGRPFSVFVNACDEDVCLSAFILANPAICAQHHHPGLNRLVTVTDLLDCTGGSYPFNPALDAVAEQAWVYEPYRMSRATRPTSVTSDGAVMRSIIQDVNHRIMLHLLGKGERAELRMGYRVTGGGRGWLMVSDEEPHARIGIFNATDAYVSWQVHRPGSFRYTIAKKSPFVPFPIGEMFTRLNAAEKECRGEGFSESWGGNEIIGGSPYSAGSAIRPEMVSEIVEQTLVRMLP